MNNKFPFYYEVRFKVLASDQENNVRTEKFTKVFKDGLPLDNRKEAFKAFEDYLSMVKENNGLEKNEYGNYSIKTPNFLLDEVDEFGNSTLDSEFYQEIGVYLICEEEELLDILHTDGLEIYPYKLNESERKIWEIEKEKVYGKLRKKYESNDPNFLDVEDIDEEDAFLLDKFIFGPIEMRYKKECLIHSVNSEEAGQFFREIEFVFPLHNEYIIYQHYSIDVSDYLTEAVYWESKEVFQFLKTPFNWRPAEIIFSESDNEERIIKNEENKKSFQEDNWYLNRIKKGESKSVEFKYNMFKNYKGKVVIKEYIPKTICGFLNAKGGILFVGVDDNGNINGIENELKNFFSGQNEEDLLYRTFDTMLRYHFDDFVTPLIELDIKELNEKKVLVIRVEESHEPIFMKNEWDKETRTLKTTFYERMNASTRPINDVKDIVKYVFNKKWKSRPFDEQND